MVVRGGNEKKRLSWCFEWRRWTFQLHRNQVTFSNESQIVIGQNNLMHVWRFSNGVYQPECTCPPHQRKVSVMIWGYIRDYMAWCGNLCKVNGYINAIKYRDILDNHLWPVLACHFDNKPYRFQDDNTPVLCSPNAHNRRIQVETMTFMAWLGPLSHQARILLKICGFVSRDLFKIQLIT